MEQVKTTEAKPEAAPKENRPQHVKTAKPQAKPKQAILPSPAREAAPVESAQTAPLRVQQPPVTAKTAVKSTKNDEHGTPLTLPRMEANPLNNPAPAYPKLSRRLAEQGTVLLQIIILRDGRVGKVSLVSSSGFARLDKAAMQAIKTWHYVPATLDGQAIEYTYLQALSFALNQRN